MGFFIYVTYKDWRNTKYLKKSNKHLIKESAEPNDITSEFHKKRWSLYFNDISPFSVLPPDFPKYHSSFSFKFMTSFDINFIA